MPSNLPHNSVRNCSVVMFSKLKLSLKLKGGTWAIIPPPPPVLKKWVWLGSVAEKSLSICYDKSSLEVPGHSWCAWELMLRSCLAAVWQMAEACLENWLFCVPAWDPGLLYALESDLWTPNRVQGSALHRQRANASPTGSQILSESWSWGECILPVACHSFFCIQAHISKGNEPDGVQKKHNFKLESVE